MMCLGPAKYVQLQAVVELARRALAEQIQERDAMSSPQAVRNYLRFSLGARPHEVFVTLTQTSVYPREVVRTALRHNAAGVIFAHNHPASRSRAARMSF
jgi:DNA repair protein RadC